MSDDSYGRNVPQEKKLKFLISKYSHFEFSKDFPGKVCARKFIDTFDSLFFTLCKNSGPPPSFDDATLAYQGQKPPIFNKKIQDIKKVLDYIDPVYKPFYEEIINWPTSNKETHDEEEFDNTED